MTTNLEKQRADWKTIDWKFTSKIMVNFTKWVSPSTDYQSIYLYTDLYARKGTSILLLLGSDDGVTVWLNGKEIFRNISLRTAIPGDDGIRLNLKKGRNFLYFRVNNATGAWKLIAEMKKLII